MRRLLALVAAIGIVLSAVIIGAHALSELIPPSPLLSNYLCSPQPCWHDIYPGTTSIPQADQIIRSDASLTVDGLRSNSDELCWLGAESRGCLYASGAGSYISMTTPQSPYRHGPLTFGDAISLYGPPLGTTTCTDLSNDYRVFVELDFRENILVTSAPFYVTPTTERLNLGTPVDVIYYNVGPIAAMMPWQGPGPIRQVAEC